MHFAMLILLIPAWLAVCAVFFLNELGYWLLFSWWRKPHPTRQPAAGATGEITASIIVLNWNGEDLLAECLPSVVEAVQHDGGQHEIIVVDNGSTDGSVDLLKKRFPMVKMICLEKNRFFTGGNNAGARAAQNDILVFLNNDMIVDKNFLRPLLDPFVSDRDLFAVSCQIFFWDPTKRREETGKTRAAWRRGWIEYRHDTPTEGDVRNRYVPAFWPGGGSAAMHREKFLATGGFDTLMDPFYLEDTDIGYQAWKRGWKILFCPVSRVLHKHRGTNSRLWERDFVERIIRRNRFLFIWKNITDFRLLLQHLWWFPHSLRRMSCAVSAGEMTRTYCMAIAKLPEALWKRNRCRLWYSRSDREAFRISNNTLEYKQHFLPLSPVGCGDRLRILFVCAYLPSPLHAGGGRMLQMIRGMSLKHEVSVLAFSDNQEERSYIPELEKMCKRLVVVDRKQHHDRESVIRHLPAPISVQFGDPKFGEILREMLGDDDYDVVQCEYVQMAYQMSVLRREVTVLTDHEVQHAAILQRMKMEHSTWRKLRLIPEWMQWLEAEISLCRKFDQVVALTEEDAWSLQRFDPRLPVEVIPMGVDPDHFHPPESNGSGNSLVYVGNFRHEPNVDAALYLVNEILPRVRQRLPDVEVSLVGAWPPPEVQVLASKHGVTVTGWVNDLRPYLDRASMLVVPIRLGVGMRGKVLEAMAMGKAVAATPLACAGLKAQHGEHVWIAENVDEFANGIVTLLTDANLRRRLGDNGRQLVESRYSWNSAVTKQVATYFDCLERKGRLTNA
jgi:GT2 family glycosyltransferase/glycosyltransferase involved in cell wall biosynthesis